MDKKGNEHVWKSEKLKSKKQLKKMKSFRIRIDELTEEMSVFSQTETSEEAGYLPFTEQFLFHYSAWSQSVLTVCLCTDWMAFSWLLLSRHRLSFWVSDSWLDVFMTHTEKSWNWLIKMNNDSADHNDSQNVAFSTIACLRDVYEVSLGKFGNRREC